MRISWLPVTTKEKIRLRQFVGAVLIIIGVAAGFGSMRSDGADDAIEQGRALQAAALSLGCIVVGLILLFWKAKKRGGGDVRET